MFLLLLTIFDENTTVFLVNPWYNLFIATDLNGA